MLALLSEIYIEILKYQNSWNKKKDFFE